MCALCFVCLGCVLRFAHNCKSNNENKSNHKNILKEINNLAAHASREDTTHRAQETRDAHAMALRANCDAG